MSSDSKTGQALVPGKSQDSLPAELLDNGSSDKTLQNKALRLIQLPHDILFLVFTEAIDLSPPFEYHSFLKETRWDVLLREDSSLLRPSSNALTVFTRVSKHWNGTATPMLYQKLRLHTDHQISIAADTLEHRHTKPAPWLGTSHGSFVKTLSMGNLYYTTKDPAVVMKMQRLIIHSPNLQSYRTALYHNLPNLAGSLNYSTRVVRSLLKTGQYLTVLHLADSKFRMPDVTSLVKGLRALEILIISSMILWEIQGTGSRVISSSLKRLVINEPEGSPEIGLGQFRNILDTVSGWVLPKFDSVLIHDCYDIEVALQGMTAFFTAHRAKLRHIVFRHWVKPFSDREVLLLTEQFPGFRNVDSTPNSVQFSR